MEYTKSARSVGLIFLLMSFILTIIFFAVEHVIKVEFQANEITITSFFMSTLKWILIICIVGFLWRGIGLVIAGGRWRIVLTNEYILWEVPKSSNFWWVRSDDTFRINLKEIDYIVLEGGSDRGSEDIYRTDLVFVTKSGDKYIVSNESGINLIRIVKKLEQLGVTVQRLTSGHNQNQL